MSLTGVPPAVFMREGSPDDPRAQRTRRLLLETFEEAVVQGKRAVTVAELTRIAGVSRSTFYSHFADIDEVGVAALREVLTDFHSLPSSNRADLTETSPDPTASLQELISHLGSHHALCRALLTADGGKPHPAAQELRSILVDHFEISIAALGSRLPVEARTAAHFVVGGFMAIVVDWLGDASTSPVSLADSVTTLLPDWLRNAVALGRPLRVSEGGDA